MTTFAMEQWNEPLLRAVPVKGPKKLMNPFASRHAAYFSAALVVVCVLAAWPFAETGLNDDFSYVFTARTLAQTGHIHYVGWASAMLGWQLALGAAFIKLFGFSFSVVRSSVLLITALTTILLHHSCLRCGLTRRNATCSVLVVMLSPLTFPLAFSFMSDMAGVLCTVLCFYCCLRAIQTTSLAAAGWLSFASLSTAIGGTARQTGWLGLFIMVPCAFWLVRKRAPRIHWVVPVWLVSLCFVYGSMRWFSRQLYSVRELPVAGYIDRDLLLHFAANLFRSALQLCFLALPVLLAFVPFAFRRKRMALFGVGSAVLLVLSALYLGRKHQLDAWLPPFRVEGNFVSTRGLVYVPEIGTHVTVVPVWTQVLLLLAILCGLFGLACLLLQRKRDEPVRLATGVPTWKQLLLLVVPFVAVSLLLILHRAMFADAYDRYFLPLLPLLLILLVRLYQQRSPLPQLPAICYGLLSLYALFGIMGLHDLFSERRARVAAGERLIAAGVPRTAFYGGFEYDGWTQIANVGYMNVGYMVWPDGVHVEKPVPRHMQVKPCDEHFAQNDPAIEPRYGISFDQIACDGPSTFAPEPYHTWLPPYDQQLYIRTVTRKPY